MSDASKRILLSEQRCKELNEIKRAGESYDELLRRLIREHHRRNLSERVEAVCELDRDELTPLHEM